MPLPERTQQIRCPKVLLVEGKTAFTFFIYYLEHLKIEDVQVINFGGNADLNDRLKGIVVMPKFRDQVTACGIIRDAEDNAAAAFDSVCHGLKSVGMTPPGQQGERVDGNPAIGIYLLPGGMRAGMLETLCLESVADDQALTCVDDLFTCLKGRGLDVPSNMTKARAHAFLSTRIAPELLVGTAARAGYWKWSHPAFTPLENFLRSL